MVGRNIVIHIRKTNKLKYLRSFDIIILTLIFWASGIISSTVAYIDMLNKPALGAIDVLENTNFSSVDNYYALAYQALYFVLALLYLKFRNFDFSIWKMQINIKSIIYGVLLFIGAALCMDIYALLTQNLENVLPFPGSIGAFFHLETVSTVIYSIFNGIYEEIYFLGVCFAVQPKALKWVIPFSLLVRISFHTYQGMLSAIGIGLIFGIYMLYTFHKSKSKNLLPFFCAHAMGDIFGLGILRTL